MKKIIFFSLLIINAASLIGMDRFAKYEYELKDVSKIPYTKDVLVEVMCFPYSPEVVSYFIDQGADPFISEYDALTNEERTDLDLRVQWEKFRHELSGKEYEEKCKMAEAGLIPVPKPRWESGAIKKGGEEGERIRAQRLPLEALALYSLWPLENAENTLKKFAALTKNLTTENILKMINHKTAEKCSAIHILTQDCAPIFRQGFSHEAMQRLPQEPHQALLNKLLETKATLETKQ